MTDRSKEGDNGETAAWRKKYEHAVASAEREEARVKSKAEKASLRGRLDAIADRIRRLEKEMDFSLLYNPKKQLFSTGYIVAENKLANAYYDMAVSEARLTSYLAIAKGDVEPAHFDKLEMCIRDSDWCVRFAETKENEFHVIESDSDELENRLPSGNANLLNASLTYGGLEMCIRDRCVAIPKADLLQAMRMLRGEAYILIVKDLNDMQNYFTDK